MCGIVRKFAKSIWSRHSFLILLFLCISMSYALSQNALTLYQLKSAVIDSVNLAIPQYNNFGNFKVSKIISYKNS